MRNSSIFIRMVFLLLLFFCKSTTGPSARQVDTVDVGSLPRAICFNPNTNRIYVVNIGSDDVTVIYGSGNTTGTVDVGDDPCAICVNPTTNRIYVVNGYSADITVIDIEKKRKVKDFVSKSKNSPFIGWELTGFPTHTIVKGRIVMENGKIVPS